MFLLNTELAYPMSSYISFESLGSLSVSVLLAPDIIWEVVQPSFASEFPLCPGQLPLVASPPHFLRGQAGKTLAGFSSPDCSTMDRCPVCSSSYAMGLSTRSITDTKVANFEIAANGPGSEGSSHTRGVWPCPPT